jgi:hypothetical protein
MGLFDIVTKFIKDVPIVGDVVKGVTSFIDLVDDDPRKKGKGRFGNLFPAGSTPIEPVKSPIVKEEGSKVRQITPPVGPSLANYRRYIEGTRGYKDLIRIAQAEAGETVAKTPSGKVPTVRGGTPRVPSSKTLTV